MSQILVSISCSVVKHSAQHHIRSPALHSTKYMLLGHQQQSQYRPFSAHIASKRTPMNRTAPPSPRSAPPVDVELEPRRWTKKYVRALSIKRKDVATCLQYPQAASSAEEHFLVKRLQRCFQGTSKAKLETFPEGKYSYIWSAWDLCYRLENSNRWETPETASAGLSAALIDLSRATSPRYQIHTPEVESYSEDDEGLGDELSDTSSEHRLALHDSSHSPQMYVPTSPWSLYLF